MSDTFAGGNARIEVDVDANADAAADEVQRELTDAFAQAMRSPAVQKALAGLIKSITKQFDNIGTAAKKALDQTTKASNQAASKMVKDFQRVAEAANKATQLKGANQPLNAMNASVAALTNNFEELLNATKTQIRAIEELGRQQRAASSDTERANRSEVLNATRLAALENTRIQRQAALIRQLGQNSAALIRSFSRITVQVMRSVTRVVELTWKSAERAVRAFARGAASVIRGLGHTVQAAFSAMGRAATHAFSGLGRGLGRIMAGISRTIQSALRRDENAFRQSFSRRERDLNASLGRQQRAQQRFQERQRSGLLGGLGGAGLLGGLAAGGGIAGLLTSGFERFGQQESLQLQFQTLLQDGPRANAMLQQISDYARTTRFDFVEVAGSVAQLTAAFGDADRAFATNKFLADLVSLTGGGTQQFAAARLAFSQIAASGRLEGQELNQLLESIPGVPLVSILADRFFGGDQAAFQDARRAGELGGIITSDAFFEALQEGAAERFPELEGFAQKVGQTMGGLADNLRENFAIFGAQIIGLAEGPLKRAMNAINNTLIAVGGFVSGNIFETGSPTSGLSAGGRADEGLEQSVIDERRAEQLEGLRNLRDLLADMSKSIGIVLGLAGAFKLLRLALIGITSPLGLLVIAAAGIGAAWSRMVENSEGLRFTLKVLKDQIGPTVAAFKQFFGLLGGAIGRTLFGKGGDNNIFKRMGDGLRYAIVYLARGVVAIRHFVNTLSLLIAAGRADLIDDVIVGRLVDFSKSIGEFLGGIFGIDQADIDAEGGGIAGFLRNTFLEPVINFFTKTVPEALGGVPDFIGQIFNAIFGGDEAGGPGARFRGEEGGGGSTATRILNVLDTTILGPIVRFFRGPFSDGVEAAIGGAVDIFRTLIDGIEAAWRFLEPILDPLTDAFRDFFTTFREEGAGAAFGSLGRGLLDTLGNIGSRILDGLIAVKDTVLPAIAEKLDPILDGIKDWAADTFTAENLAAVGLEVLNIAREIGQALGRIIGDPRVLGALAALAASLAILIASFIRGVFEGLGENAGEWGGLVIDGLNAAFGGILPDSITDNGALSTAIGLAVVAAISAGLIFAGRRVAAAGTRPGPGGGFSLGTLGLSIAGGLFNTIKTTFSALFRGGTALFSSTRRENLETNPAVKGIGQSVGVGIATAIGIGFGGYSIGQNVSGPGGLLLSAIFGAGTGAAVGLSIGGPLGAAIGAALGGAIGLISAEFGQGAEKAAEMREEVKLLADELQDLVGLDLQATLSANLAEAAVSAGLDDELDLSANFNFGALAQDIIEGTATVEGEMLTFLSGISDAAIEAAGITREQFNAAFQSFAESGLPLDQFIANGLEGSEVFTKLGISGRTAGDLIDYFSHNIGVANSALGQIGGEEAAASIDTVAEAVQQLNDSFSADATGRVRATADDIARLLNQTDLTSQERIEAIQEVAGNARDAIEEARDAIAELLGQQLAPDTVQAVQDAFVVGLPGLEDQYQGIIDRLSEGEISFSVSESSKRDLLAGFSGDVESTITEAINAGLITSPADLTDFVGGLRQSIIDAELGGDLTSELLGQLDAIDPSAFSALFLALTTGLQQSSLADDVIAILGEAGGPSAAAFRASFDAGLGGIVEGFTAGGVGPRATGGAGGTDAIGATITGQIGDSVVANSSDITTGITDAATAAFGDAAASPALTTGAPEVGKTISQQLGFGVTANAGLVASAVSQTISAAAVSGLFGAVQMYQVGVAMGAGLTSGIASQIQSAANTAALLAQAAINAAKARLQSKSPSRVFINIGRDIGRGFIQGIKDSEGDMVTALSDALENVITKAQEKAAAAVRRAQVGQAIFDALAPSPLPGGTTQSQITQLRAAIQEAIAGFKDVLDQAASSALGSDAGAVFNATVGAQGARLGLANSLRDTLTKFNEALKLQKDRAAYDAKKADLDAKLKAGLITKKQFDDAIEKLGERPVSLTHEQLNLLASGPTSLNPTTVAGQANIAALQQALEAVRAYGQAALEAGVPIGQVTDQMQSYIAGIIAEAKARGFNVTEILKIIDQLGLSAADLAELQRQLLSLDIATLAGSANVQTINEQLQAIRDYASELLGAGVAPAEVAKQVKALRDQLIAAAKQYGFNATQLAALVKAAGLSDSSLANLIKQLAEFEAAAAGAGQAAKDAADKAAEAAKPPVEPVEDPGFVPRPTSVVVNLTTPYGDPEAIGLGVLNAIAYDLSPN